MPITFFIGSTKMIGGSEWIEYPAYTINIDNFSEELKKKWPDALIGPAGTPSQALEWRLNKDAYSEQFALDSKKQFVIAEAVSKSNLIEFTLWYRKYIPSEFKLFLFDESLALVIELVDKISRETLEKNITGS
jgi:hypothetical protein